MNSVFVKPDIYSVIFFVNFVETTQTKVQLLCTHSNSDLYICNQDINMLCSCIKISCF